jgi:hypothetical protein
MWCCNLGHRLCVCVCSSCQSTPVRVQEIPGRVITHAALLDNYLCVGAGKTGESGDVGVPVCGGGYMCLRCQFEL